MARRFLMAAMALAFLASARAEDGQKPGWELTPPTTYQGKLNSLALLNIRGAELDVVADRLVAEFA